MELDAPEISKTTPARERIRLTAYKLFYRDGIRATGIDRVIQEAGVTKVTFYRHFPSKTALIHAFLVFRHERWMAWFRDALQRHGGDVNALAPTLAEWMRDGSFRGCAFINSLAELGGSMPDIVELTLRHKQEMTAVIESLLAPSRRRKQLAEAIALAVDGAIIRAQYDPSSDSPLLAMNRILKALLRSKG